MKIGIFSGSFDPIHTGHAMVANYTAQSGLVDRVWLMVSRINPLKCSTPPADSSERLEMARLVGSGCRGVEVSDFELHLPSPSYTYKTLCELRKAYPMHSFLLIIGSDNWLEFNRWKDPEKIISEFGILIYERPGYPVPEALPPGVEMIKGAPLALISSTFVRESIKENKNINFFVPEKVVDYITNKGLYGAKK